MQDAKEEVRARLAIEDVIGEYVELKRAGRNFKGLSPFTGERTPSFFVSPEKNIWHDFSSNKGGDIFSFIMEVEGLGFREALEHLARKANVDLSLYSSDKQRSLAKKKQRLFELHEWAARFFQHHMVKNTTAVQYIFKTRGIDKATVQAFGIGYAPGGGRELVRFLAQKGFRTPEIEAAGVANRFGGDLFKDRMMVPLMDGGGRVIGFTGRIIGDDPNAPKYLNTPQTLLYDKSWHVFGLSQAKEAIRTHDYAVVVEGNLDVVSSHQAGVKQVVATAGTAMTIHHLKTIGRLTRNVRLAFDGDKAGLAATERAIPIAQEAGVELTIISLPEDVKDPDELIQRDPALWQAAIDAAEPVVDWILHQYQQQHDTSTAAGKRAYTTAGLQVVASLCDPVEQEHYLQKMAAAIGGSVRVLQAKMQHRPQKAPAKKPVARTAHTKPTRAEYEKEDALLSLALQQPTVRQAVCELSPDMLRGEAQKTFLEQLQHQTEDLQNPSDYVKILLLRADARYAGWSEQDRLHEAARLIRHIKDEYKKQQKDTLTAALRDAEAVGDDDRMRSLLEQIQALNKEIYRDTAAKR